MNTMITQEEIKKSYNKPRNWTAYNHAQVNEKLLFFDILHELTGYVPLSEHKVGKPRLNLQDMIFCITLKQYENVSARRNSSNLELAKRRGYINHVPHFNTTLKYTNQSEITPLLQELIKLSALPLKNLEQHFAIDSTGLSSGKYSCWFDTKFNKRNKYSEWIKLHITSGVKTNIVTSVILTDRKGKGTGDSSQFKELVKQTNELFDISEISADKAYSSRDNLQFVWDLGAIPYIPFKSNSNKNQKGSQAWGIMNWWFYNYQDKFKERYHLRSNVECTFSMIKRKFSSHLRSKNRISMVNEALITVLCHNICVLIHEVYASETELNFPSFIKFFNFLQEKKEVELK